VSLDGLTEELETWAPATQYPPLDPKEFKQKNKPREALSYKPSVLTRRFFVAASLGTAEA
jgi:hypothetical protein